MAETFVKQQQGALLLAPQAGTDELQVDAAVRREICQRTLAIATTRSLQPHVLNLVANQG